jgi:eukaryotic-like serine/threonine-protein kinase
MNFFKFLLSKVFLKNLVIAIGILLILVGGTLIGLRIYTQHGKTYPVPKYEGLHIDSVKTICMASGFRVEIIDSVFVNKLDGGIVIEQYPDSGILVKENRTLYFTINAFEAEKVPMPNLIELTFRKAKSVLSNNNLKVGEISYIPDLAKHRVLKQIINDIEVDPGELVIKGSNVDLVLGQGLSKDRTLIPSLITLTVDSARQVASTAYLNIGAVVQDETINDEKDIENARIYKHSPPSDGKTMIFLGSPVDVWVTLDTTKLPVDTINIENFNSLEVEN